MTKVNSKGKPLTVPQEIKFIIRELGVSAPEDEQIRKEYLETLGYVEVKPTLIPTPPPELNGKCRIEQTIPTRDANGSYIRAYKFIELTKDELEIADANNRLKRDKTLATFVDSINAVRWASMSPEKQEAWTKFRTALLDITDQPGWPANLVWPKIPS